MTEATSKITKEHIKALKSGDQQVLHSIFMEFQPRIYRFLWLKTKSIEVAEDLVQETFLRLWEARKRLNPGSNLETYIFRIASNLATDQLRKDERHKELHPLSENRELTPPSSQDMAEYNQLAQVVDNIIAALPEGPRTAFLLSRYEELSHREISEIMDISTKTVEKHISKALQVLKEKLEKSDIASSS